MICWLIDFHDLLKWWIRWQCHNVLSFDHCTYIERKNVWNESLSSSWIDHFENVYEWNKRLFYATITFICLFLSCFYSFCVCVCRQLFVGLIDFTNTLFYWFRPIEGMRQTNEKNREHVISNGVRRLIENAFACKTIPNWKRSMFNRFDLDDNSIYIIYIYIPFERLLCECRNAFIRQTHVIPNNDRHTVTSLLAIEAEMNEQTKHTHCNQIKENHTENITSNINTTSTLTHIKTNTVGHMWLWSLS